MVAERQEDETHDMPVTALVVTEDTPSIEFAVLIWATCTGVADGLL